MLLRAAVAADTGDQAQKAFECALASEGFKSGGVSFKVIS